MSWDTSRMPRLDGRRALITGANSGIGYVAARELARAGARVVLGCRDPGRGEAALARLREAVPGADAELVRLDLADLASVRAVAQGRDEPLDLLVNNAGVMALPGRAVTADGFEMQFGTNHLGHFALTGLLLDRLLAGDDPRVVTISSNAHKFGSIDFDDLQGDRYRRWKAYGQSKLANLLFAFELDRRHGERLRSLAAHPGYSATHLQGQSARARSNPLLKLGDALVNQAANLFLAQSDEQGALPTLFAATEDLAGGTYVGPRGPGEWRGPPQMVIAAPRAYDTGTAQRLWSVSEELTGVSY